MIRSDVRSPCPISLFQSQAFDGPVASIDQPHISACFHDDVVHGGGRFHRQMQFPTQFAHIGDPQGHHLTAGDTNAAPRGKGKLFVGYVGGGDSLQNRTSMGTHQCEYRIGRRDVHQLRVQRRRDGGLDPMKVVSHKPCTGDDVELIMGHSGHGEVALDSACVVEHLGVGDGPHRLVHVVGAQPVECRQRVGPLQHEFGEGGLIEQRHRLTSSKMLAANGGKPVGTLVRVPIMWCLAPACISEPVGALPAHLLAETRTLRQ